MRRTIIFIMTFMISLAMLGCSGVDENIEIDQYYLTDISRCITALNDNDSNTDCTNLDGLLDLYANHFASYLDDEEITFSHNLNSDPSAQLRLFIIFENLPSDYARSRFTLMSRIYNEIFEDLSEIALDAGGLSFDAQVFFYGHLDVYIRERDVYSFVYLNSGVTGSRTSYIMYSQENALNYGYSTRVGMLENAYDLNIYDKVSFRVNNDEGYLYILLDKTYKTYSLDLHSYDGSLDEGDKDSFRNKIESNFPDYTETN